MPLKPGWEVSPDREKQFQAIVETVPIGEPIITSKCKVDGDNGFLVAGKNGWAWTGKAGLMKLITGDFWSLGKKKWVRWYDVYKMGYNEKGLAVVEAVKRNKDGTVKKKKDGVPKTKAMILIADRNKDEPKDKWKERKKMFGEEFYMIFEKNKARVPPAETDSKY